MKRSIAVPLLPFVLAACTGLIEDPGEIAGPRGGAQGSPQGSGGTTGENPKVPGPVTLPGGLALNGTPVHYRFVRLTHEQWENSVRDVLLLPARPGLSSGFVPDPPDGKFGNNEKALYVSANLRTDYQRVAESLAETVARDPAALARLGSAADSAGFIRDLGRRAYRRPLSPDEESTYQALFASGKTLFASGDDFADGAQVVIEAMLQSPHFLYRVELSPDGQRLSGYELAGKLSLLLRNTTPDDGLLDAASGGQLDSDSGLVAVATQMLSAATAGEVLDAFHGELFGLDRYGSILKSTSLFPTYSEALNETLLQADQLFFRHVFESGRGLREILTSNVAYVNQATAGFYGISAPSAELVQVTLDASRPGFLTRLGFLAYNATLRDPDPIHRGVDINRRILCNTLEPPAGEIPPLPEVMPGQTNRERVTAHTGEGFCAGCHATVINPLGFALENFDAMGQARSTDNGKPVDTTGEYPFSDGMKSFSGIVELARLLGDSQQAHGCYAANLVEYALARDVAGGDGELVSELQKMSLEQDLSIKDVLLKTVQSSLFTHAKGGAE